MIKDIFGCEVKVYSVVVDNEGEITEKEIKRFTDSTLEQLEKEKGGDHTVMDDPTKAYLFRFDLEHKGRKSEIYLDLFDRIHKANGTNATFTIQGSCVNDEESEGYQKPIAYLMGSASPEQPFLSFAQVRNIFHELGHAMHVALSQTKFQLISGSRVPLDFAEIPSHFTEQYIYDYDFVKQWAVDDSSKPIDKELFQKMILKERITELVDLEETAYFSLLDLNFHTLTQEELSEKKLIDINSEMVSLSILVKPYSYHITLKKL